MITHDGTVARRAQHIKHLLDGVFVDGAAALARDMADVVAEAADLAEKDVASQVTKAFETLGESVREDAGADATEGVREDALAGGDEGEDVEGDRLPWDDKPAWDGDGAWDDDRVWDEEFTWSGDDAVTGIMPPIAEDVGPLDSEATGILEPVRADVTEVMRPLADVTEVMAPIDGPKAAVPIDATLVMPPVGEDGPAAKDGSALKGAKARKAKAGKGERRG